MRVVIIGQQDFGKAVMEAFLDRNDEVAGVFCAPEKPGGRPDPLRVAAEERQQLVFQYPSLKSPEALETMRRLKADIGIMAYVLQFAPQEFVNIPTHGTIQYHPSLLPEFRGPSSINWPIILGAEKTGLTIFRPNDGLDEGPVVLQKEVAIGPDDTIGSVYFNQLFPLGVKAMLEAADLVVNGRHKEVVQDEAAARYEGWCKEPAVEVNWHSHVDTIYNLIRGCNPAPGAWTTFQGRKVQLFDSRKHRFRTFGAVKGKSGEISEIGGDSIRITAQGGQIEVFKVKPEGGKKIAAVDFVREAGLELGTMFGS